MDRNKLQQLLSKSYICWMLCCYGASADEQIRRLDPESTVAALRNFLENPKPIEKVVFKRIFLENDVPAKGQNNAMYFGRWQDNAFFFREFKARADIEAKDPHGCLVFVGRYDDDFWLLENHYLSTWHGSMADLDRDRNNVTLIASTANRIFSEVLTLGAFRLRCGSFRWSSSDFTAQSWEGERVTGKLLLSPVGLPARLEYSIPSIATDYTVDYRYDQELPVSQLPSAFLLSLRTKSTNATFLQIQVDSMELREVEMPRTAFSPEEFVDPIIRKSLGTILYTNKGVYFRNSTGRYQPVPSLPSANHAPKWGRSILLLFSVGPIVLGLVLWVIRKKRNTTRTTNIKPYEN